MILRPANIDDAERLFNWRNDPLTRAMSINTAPVEWDGHIGWLKRRLSLPAPNLYVAEVDGVPVGTVRVDDDEISYTVAPERRGKGFATQMLIAARRQFGSLCAEIKRENEASIRAAVSAGHKVVLI